MRLLHTSDWHLGKKLVDFSRIREQEVVLNEIISIAEAKKVNAVLIAGDLFDSANPSIEAIDLFYRTLNRLGQNGNCAVIAIAGNHDSPDRIEAPIPLAIENGIILVGYPSTIVRKFKLLTGLELTRSEAGFIELRLPKIDYPLRILLTPYANELRLREFLGIDNREAKLRTLLKKKWYRLANTYCDDQGINILLAHLFFTKKGDKLEEEPDGEKSILTIGGAQEIFTNSIPKQIQYSALGHLHRYHAIVEEPVPVYYSGSILPYSFSEAEQKKYISIIDLEPNKSAKIENIEIKSGYVLYKKAFNSIDSAIEWLEANPMSLVELKIKSNTYLSTDERKRLYNVHNGIITLIPEITDSKLINNLPTLQLMDNMTDIFKSYFRQRNNGQEPNNDILAIFQEILSERGLK